MCTSKVRCTSHRRVDTKLRFLLRCELSTTRLAQNCTRKDRRYTLKTLCDRAKHTRLQDAHRRTQAHSHLVGAQAMEAASACTVAHGDVQPNQENLLKDSLVSAVGVPNPKMPDSATAVPCAGSEGVQKWSLLHAHLSERMCCTWCTVESRYS